LLVLNAFAWNIVELEPDSPEPIWIVLLKEIAACTVSFSTVCHLSYILRVSTHDQYKNDKTTQMAFFSPGKVIFHRPIYFCPFHTLHHPSRRGRGWSIIQLLSKRSFSNCTLFHRIVLSQEIKQIISYIPSQIWFWIIPFLSNSLL
jgi:hypothetical protein